MGPARVTSDSPTEPGSAFLHILTGLSLRVQLGNGMGGQREVASCPGKAVSACYHDFLHFPFNGRS